MKRNLVMSSDNGIYILETDGPEYRIAYAQAIDNIYGVFNDETNHWKGDDKMILEYFGSSKMYNDLQEAWDIATLWSEDHHYLEDGICLIRDFKDRKFSELR